jgi:two-component system response regulator ChvI
LGHGQETIQGQETRQSRRILVVDDDALFLESLQGNLTDAGFAVTGFTNGPSVITALQEGIGADLLLLDWSMPGMTGIQVLRNLRDSSQAIPAVFLTGLSDQIYEEAALNLGALDFIEKDRSFAILQKRIDLIFEGSRDAVDPALTSGDAATRISIALLELRRESHRAIWDGHELPLTLNEFRIVDLLVSQAGEDVGYRDIYDLVRGVGFAAGEGPEGHRQNVRTFIKRIRRKFLDADPTFSYIENYAGFGYRWRR